MSQFVYILRSQKDGTYYYGSTDDVQKRLKEHNAGKSRFTKGQRPYLLHYQEEFPTKCEALKREAFFKSIQGHSWLCANNIIQTRSARGGPPPRITPGGDPTPASFP